MTRTSNPNTTPPASQTLPQLADHHCLLVGGTRRGKSGALQLMARAVLLSATGEGVSMIDPVGGCPRDVRDWLANPGNGQYGRALHYLDPNSNYTFGLNPLQVVNPDSWDQCHEAASTLTSVIESRFEASAEETPRLSRLVYCTAMVCARKQLTLIEALEVLSLGGHHLRGAVLADFNNNHIVRRELEDLITLATKNPREFLSLVESTHNRFVRWLGSPTLARILGQTSGLDPRGVMDRGEIVLADFSGVPPSDAALLGCITNAMYFLAARKRPPLEGLRHRLILDESESLLTIDTARMTDQSAKHGLLLTACIQRLGQARARDDDLLESLMVNCGLKICFGGLESESARYMTENLFAGHVNLEEWKQSTIRPTVIGNEMIMLRGRTTGRHRSEQSAEAVTNMHSSSRMRGIADTNMFGWGSVFSSGTTINASMLPDGGLLTTPTSLTNSTGRNSLSGQSASGARSRVRTAAEQDANGHARTAGRGQAHGSIEIAAENQSVVARFSDLPQQQFTLEEQLFKLASQVATLPRRQCVFRLEDQAPVLTRTEDLKPAFRSEAFKRQILPLFLARANRNSAFLRPVEIVDAEIAARVAGVTAPAFEEPDFSAPEPARRPRLVKGDN